MSELMFVATNIDIFKEILYLILPVSRYYSLSVSCKTLHDKMGEISRDNSFWNEMLLRYHNMEISTPAIRKDVYHLMEYSTTKVINKGFLLRMFNEKFERIKSMKRMQYHRYQGQQRVNITISHNIDYVKKQPQKIKNNLSVEGNWIPFIVASQHLSKSILFDLDTLHDRFKTITYISSKLSEEHRMYYLNYLCITEQTVKGFPSNKVKSSNISTVFDMAQYNPEKYRLLHSGSDILYDIVAGIEVNSCGKDMNENIDLLCAALHRYNYNTALFLLSEIDDYSLFDHNLQFKIFVLSTRLSNKRKTLSRAILERLKNSRLLGVYRDAFTVFHGMSRDLHLELSLVSFKHHLQWYFWEMDDPSICPDLKIDYSLLLKR